MKIIIPTHKKDLHILQYTINSLLKNMSINCNIKMGGGVSKTKMIQKILKNIER
ncbi:hypothetical protein [Helicobacter sp. MIT 14-3879]|uniref:hypothetical protein n=1 Tax=Helicobacter sp. MIT 14-3879 TaxID=2040649 RepID=UPI0015F149FF|nr:hypothetical protein [Helicobacter sp. MIT 14-3879]